MSIILNTNPGHLRTMTTFTTKNRLPCQGSDWHVKPYTWQVVWNQTAFQTGHGSSWHSYFSSNDQTLVLLLAQECRHTLSGRFPLQAFLPQPPVPPTTLVNRPTLPGDKRPTLSPWENDGIFYRRCFFHILQEWDSFFSWKSKGHSPGSRVQRSSVNSAAIRRDRVDTPPGRIFRLFGKTKITSLIGKKFFREVRHSGKEIMKKVIFSVNLFLRKEILMESGRSPFRGNFRGKSWAGAASSAVPEINLLTRRMNLR